MIPFDFTYCRPNTLAEAIKAHTQLTSEGKNAVYYAGGSEIITMCRAGSIRPDAVIDIKTIPECRELKVDDRALHIGAACTLNQIKESKLFPLLGLACGRIADHTNQCRITLGGNLCGTIIYRETSLPLLLADAKITLCGPGGCRTLPFRDAFWRRMRLDPGEMVVTVHIPAWCLSARHFHAKKTANEKIDYPLVSICALFRGDYLGIAFSGVCSFPFRSGKIEAVLNDRTQTPQARAQKAAELLPEPAHTDAEASGEYRLFVLKNTLTALLEDWENGAI
ncbi:MAG: FAD binding domain-containing protein [Christensenellales bacterium]